MKKIITLLFILFVFCFGLKSQESLKFAIITDIHQDIMHDGEERLQDFVDAARENKVYFIIDLGDFCFPKEENLSFLNRWNEFSGDKYHALGNHDMDICSKEEYMAFTGMPSRYYSFDKGKYHFIVLDPNVILKDKKYIPFKKGNYYSESSLNHIDPEQAEWLKKDLRSTDKRCLIFSHQSLENTVENRKEIQNILEEENRRVGFKKVIAAFSGHDHTDYSKEINGITYIQINSASNQWVGEKYACPERFSEEINKKRPAVKYTVPYKDALFAIVTLTNEGLQLEGKESSFIPPTPTDIGIPTDKSPYPLVPKISNYQVTF